MRIKIIEYIIYTKLLCVVDSLIDDKLGKEQQFDNVQKIDEYEAEAELSLGNLYMYL